MFGFFGELVDKIKSGGAVVRFEPAAWDDIRFPANGARLDTSSGRLDFNFDECGIDFQDNARFPNEPICFIAQFSHSKKLDSIVNPHIHWIQNQNVIPNWLLQYRWYRNGDEVPAYTTAKFTTSIFNFVLNPILQITSFPDLTPPTGETVSSILDIRLFRDNNNDSGLFAGSDTYIGDALLKEFDIHFQKDTNGSTMVFMK